MAVTPDTLTPAARRLYEQFEQLEVDGASEGWPIATICAALAAPIDLLYLMVMVGEVPFAPVFDPVIADEVFTDDQARQVLPYSGQYIGVQEIQELPPIGQRLRLLETPAAKIGSVDAIRGAARTHAIGPDGTPSSATVYVIERVGGDPYHFAVTMFTSEVPDPDVTRRDIEAVTPGGRFGSAPGTLFDFFLIDGGTYEDLLATHANYQDVLNDFATYEDLLEDPGHT